MIKPRTHDLLHFIDSVQKSIGILPLSGTLSKAIVAGNLRSLGFKDFKLYTVDHHASHAATAAFTSGFSKGLVVTMDGLGDGLSASLSTFSNGKMERVGSVSARNSIGVFYEQVTNIVGMRELEDEGKVMAMACYSYPFPFSDNKLKDFFTVEGTTIKAKYSTLRQYDLLGRIAWSMPMEHFSYMAQQLLEHVLSKFVENAIDEYGIGNVAMAGGLFSNVKANMQVRMLPKLKSWYIFPHMGDGGSAMGAAMQVNYALNGISSYKFENSYLGDEFSDDYIRKVLANEKGIKFEADGDKSSHAAELVHDNNYVFWYQGRMEYGPRALGNRSIIAKAGSEDVKEKLNVFVKQREWFQPFCPSMLDEEAERLLDDVKGHDRFMTMAYRIKPDKIEVMRSVAHIDNTARPQMVGEENRHFREMLLKVRKLDGHGVVLNTSFNIHGMPIARTPEDALDTMRKTKTRHMFLGGFYVENKEA